MPSLNIKDYMLLGLGLGVLFLLWGYNSMGNDLEDMTNQRDKALLQIGVSEANNATLAGAIKSQNIVIKALEASKAKNLIELKKWKNKPAEVRYEVIYKEIPKEIRVKDISCEEIKNISNSLDGFNLNSL